MYKRQLISISCNDYQKLLNSTENEVDKYTAAEEYYDNGEFRRANALFEQIMPSYSGKPQGERLRFFFANSYFETKSYYLAAIQFENFIKSYPNSQRIVDAYFMEGKSYFMLSPAYSLDQEDTNTAIEKLQVFVNRYPNSEYVSEAIELIEQLQNKIEKKDFEVSKQYYTIRDYNSAIKSLDNFMADNPGTIFREEALYYRWLSTYEIAINSIESKILERVTELERSLVNFLKYYPETIFIEDLSYKLNNAKKIAEGNLEALALLTKIAVIMGLGSFFSVAASFVDLIQVPCNAGLFLTFPLRILWSTGLRLEAFTPITTCPFFTFGLLISSSINFAAFPYS